MTFADSIGRHAQLRPDKTALHFAGQDISYQQLWQQVENATRSLTEQAIGPGDRVAWLGLNDPAMLVLLLALSRIGGILLPLNYRLSRTEQWAILKRAQACLLVSDAVHHTAAQELTSRMGAAAQDELGDGNEDPMLHGTDDLLLVYTSGTTGLPKGALHTQAGLAANCLASQHAHGFSAEDHVLTALPLFHVGGLCIQTLPALVCGATVTLHARFEPGEWLRDVAARRPTVSLLVPATLRAVIGHPEFASSDLSSLRLLNAGSSTIPLSLIETFHARGVPVCQVYGSTETGPVSIYLRQHDAMRYPGSAGQAGLNVEVRLVDGAGIEVATGEVGEIWVRAPNVMRGYWRDPQNPAFQNGWFHTGDLARCDADVFYWIVGRSKDMIISGGENIYPAEIENVLVNCADITEVAVVGLPDERWGEVAVAAIVRADGSRLDAEGVLALLHGQLARYKHPKRVVFVNALPKTALGKIQKAQLSAELGQMAAQAPGAP